MFGYIASHGVLFLAPEPNYRSQVYKNGFYSSQRQYDPVEYAWHNLKDVQNKPGGGKRKDNLAAFSIGRYLHKNTSGNFCARFKRALKIGAGAYSHLVSGKVTGKYLFIEPDGGFDTSTCTPCSKTYPSNNASSIQYFNQLKRDFYERNPSAGEDELDKELKDKWQDWTKVWPNHARGGQFQRL